MMGVMALKEGKNLGVCAHNKRLLVGEANIMPFNLETMYFHAWSLALVPLFTLQ